jgi:prevent-host-death family protein
MSKSTSEAMDARWGLEVAKAQFGEVVRRAKTEGPQTVTVQGRDEAVVISAEEYGRLKLPKTGADIWAALRASPSPDEDIEPPRFPMPVRDVDL